MTQVDHSGPRQGAPIATQQPPDHRVPDLVLLTLPEEGIANETAGVRRRNLRCAHVAARGTRTAGRARATRWRADERGRNRSRRKDRTFPVHAEPCRKWLDRWWEPPDGGSLGWRRHKSDTDFRTRLGCPTARRDH